MFLNVYKGFSVDQIVKQQGRFLIKISKVVTFLKVCAVHTQAGEGAETAP